MLTSILPALHRDRLAGPPARATLNLASWGRSAMTQAFASRRQFLSGTAMALAVAALPRTRAWAAEEPAALNVVSRSIQVKGKAATVYGLVDGGGKRGLSFISG